MLALLALLLVAHAAFAAAAAHRFSGVAEAAPAHRLTSMSGVLFSSAPSVANVSNGTRRPPHFRFMTEFDGATSEETARLKAQAKRQREARRQAVRAATEAKEERARELRRRRKKCRRKPCQPWCRHIADKPWSQKCSWEKTCCGCAPCESYLNGTTDLEHLLIAAPSPPPPPTRRSHRGAGGTSKGKRRRKSKGRAAPPSPPGLPPTLPAATPPAGNVPEGSEDASLQHKRRRRGGASRRRPLHDEQERPGGPAAAADGSLSARAAPVPRGATEPARAPATTTSGEAPTAGAGASRGVGWWSWLRHGLEAIGLWMTGGGRG